MVFLINILICDDDPIIVKQINKLLKNWSKQHNFNFLIESKNSGDFALSQNCSYDIAFIDIELPGISGLKLAEELKRSNPDIIIIVVTSFQSYLDSAMKIRVFRYLSKPIEPNRFDMNLFEAIQEYQNISRNILVETKDEVIFLKTKDILFIENKKFGSNIITKDKEIKTTKKPDEWYKTINQPQYFVYSHNSYIVNLQNVASFNKTTINFRQSDGSFISAYISQRKLSSFKKAFYAFAGGLL